MSQELCVSCDRVFDPDGSENWQAVYDPESICGSCIQDAIDQLEKERKAFKFNPMMCWSRSYTS